MVIMQYIVRQLDKQRQKIYAKIQNNRKHNLYNMEPLFKIDSFLTPCEDDDGSKKCAPLRSKNQFGLCCICCDYQQH